MALFIFIIDFVNIQILIMEKKYIYIYNIRNFHKYSKEMGREMNFINYRKQMVCGKQHSNLEKETRYESEIL